LTSEKFPAGLLAGKYIKGLGPYYNLLGGCWNMLTDQEKRILELISKQLLITKGEVMSFLNKEKVNGTDTMLQRLRDAGLIEKVESLGTCFVVTQKGIRAMQGQD
jgi:hypothetical protein